VNDTIDVRPGEALTSPALEPYLRAHLPAANGAYSVRQFGGGHANLTYLVRFGELEYVLRRPPHGPLPVGAHDMRREYTVLSNLHRSFAHAPRAFVLCTDRNVFDVDFVVMERRRGTVIRSELPAAFVGNEKLCRRLAENFVDTLAALHAVDYEAIGLASLGKPERYLERQLDGWIKRWDAAQTPGRADATGLVAQLRERLPQSGAPALVHNDYKLDNTIVDDADLASLVAVLDWDMCTIGDPLVDLGYVLSLWAQPGEHASIGVGRMPTGRPGFLSRDALTERYAWASGRDVSRIAWYRAFNLFRYAAIAQQIYARFVRGQTQDERFRQFDRGVAQLIADGTSLADGGL